MDLRANMVEKECGLGCWKERSWRKEEQGMAGWRGEGQRADVQAKEATPPAPCTHPRTDYTWA